MDSVLPQHKSSADVIAMKWNQKKRIRCTSKLYQWLLHFRCSSSYRRLRHFHSLAKPGTLFYVLQHFRHAFHNVSHESITLNIGISIACSILQVFSSWNFICNMFEILNCVEIFQSNYISVAFAFASLLAAFGCELTFHLICFVLELFFQKQWLSSHIHTIYSIYVVLRSSHRFPVCLHFACLQM